MSLGTLNTVKELSETYQPLLLCEFTFRSGNVLRVSTHPLSATYWGTPSAGSYEYGGHPWDPRVLNQDLGPTQAMSDLGVDVAPQATIVLADPDKTIFNNWENAEGFKGAILRMYAIAWDIGDTTTGSFTSDNPAPIKFIGTCHAPSYDDRSITITATSLLNMSSMQMPPVRIQPLCGWSFPTNAADRLDGITNADSRFKECAYSPDIATIGLGNYQSGTACFTSCDYSFAACVERLGDSSGVVPIEKDKSGRFTGHFGGFQWIPNQNSGLQRPYLTGKWEEIVNATNESRYGDFVPMCYGTTWVEPLVMGVWGDGNYSNFEVLLCYGFVFQILKVVVNGTEIQHYIGSDGNGDTDSGHRLPQNQIFSPSQTREWKNNFWKTVNRGYRESTPNPNAGWGRKGDPYGSIACIHIQCLRQLAPESAIPQIQVLLQAGAVRTYTDPTHFFDNDVSGANNPAWVLMDVLIWANWRYSDLDIQSFIDAAAKCRTQTYFDRMDGTYSNVYNETGSPPHYRYEVGFSIRQRVSIGELIRGLRNAMKAMLFFDYVTGKLKLVIKETIASQQPTVIDGSNYNTPVPSVTVEGIEADGYVAYHFDHTNILKTSDGRSTLQIYQKTYQDSPNKMTMVFQNRENSYSQDSATIVDVEDVSRLGQEVFGSFPLYGPQTYDHIRRIANTWFAENYRGNPRLDYQGSAIGDTGGTIMFDLQTSIKAVHLMVGQICLISDQQHGIDKQPVRVMKIQPSTNFETARVTLQFHNDNWYQDTFGQVNQPKYARPRSMVDRAPFPWRSGDRCVFPGDVYYPFSKLGFDTVTGYQASTNNTYSSYIYVAGIIPANSFPNSPGRPLLEVVGSAYVSGKAGYPSGHSYYVGLVAKDTTAAFGSNNESLCSAISKPAVVRVDDPCDAISVTVLNWPDAPQGYYAYVGRAPNTMTLQFDGSATPFGINLDGTFQQQTLPPGNTFAYRMPSTFREAMVGPPDEAFSKFRFRTRNIYVPGVFMATGISASVSNPVGSDVTQGTTHLKLALPAGVSFATNEWAGREFSKLGVDIPPDSGAEVFSPGTFRVLGNSGDTLDLLGNLLPYALVDIGYAFTFWESINYVNASGASYNGTPAPAPAFNNMFVMRMQPTFGSDADGNYFEDALLENEWGNNPLYQPVRITGATNASPIVLTLNGSGFFFNGDIVVVEGVLGNTAANGRWTVANASGNTIELSRSTGNGDYAGEGIAFKQKVGLRMNELAGKIVFVNAGTGEGTSVPVKSNTSTRVYIQGDWPVPPDSTTRVIVVDPVYLSDIETPPLKVALESVFSINNGFVIDTGAYRKNQAVLIQASTVSTNGSQSLEVLDPFVEQFIFNTYAFDGQIYLHVPGIIGIGANQAPLVSPNSDVYPVRIIVQMKAPPGGANLTLEIRSGGTLMATAIVPDSGYVVEVDQTITIVVDKVASIFGEIKSWAVLLANQPVTVDITGVGTNFPGADLTVIVCYNVN